VKNSKSIIIVGTHHTPAIELINLLRSDPKTSWQIAYIGHQYPAETHIIHTIIPKLKIPFYNLDCGKFDRKNLDKTLLSLPKIISAFFQSLSLLQKIKPDIIVSFGGYVSVPVIIAAFFKKIPSLTHEQTPVNSLSTKINSHFVNKIALSFDNKNQINQLPKNKVVITGNLLRSEIFNTDSKKFKNLPKLPIIYITGGNQGSNFINDLTLKLVPELQNKYFIIHQTGNHFSTSKTKNYYPVSYVEIEDIGWVLNHAQIVISRAGANTCQELNALNKKAIIIPLPFTQQNEQQLNAEWLQHQHPDLVVVIPQIEANSTKILDTITKLTNFPISPKPINHSPNLSLLKLIYELL
jgi:UDP-N-acetylglucosamine--N-acetylmuramyl-(pentapeptide) pyrophosphoryl-undecaprenol N-acetylglucosamine transferase